MADERFYFFEPVNRIKKIKSGNKKLRAEVKNKAAALSFNIIYRRVQNYQVTVAVSASTYANFVGREFFCLVYRE